MAKQLKLMFKNEEGNTTTLIPSRAKDGLTEAEVRPVMDGIVALDLFAKKGIKQYSEVKSAKYVETIEIDVF